MATWDRAEDYVRLLLCIDQHLPGYVDAYFGPKELREGEERTGKRDLRELAIAAEDLAAAIALDPVLDGGRRPFLLGEIGAITMVVRTLQGERIDIAEEARCLYGIAPSWVDEGTFNDARSAIDDLLPGNGSLYERLQAHDKATRIPPDRLASIIQMLVHTFRDKSRSLFRLPVTEALELDYVHDKPWLAFNWYLGKAASRIEFNLDLPFRPIDLPFVVAHEAYPGHHTGDSIKEHRFLTNLGYLEHSILPALTPSGLITEGIGNVAIEVLLSQDDLVECLRGVLAAADLPSENAPLIVGLHAAARPLASVGNNVLFLLHRDHASDDEAQACLRKFGLGSEERARRAVRFFRDPLWRSYEFTCVYGYHLVGSFIKRSPDPVAAFSGLLEGLATPSSLVHYGVD